MGRPKPITACDCETDPFLFNRVPEPFIWGFADGENFVHFNKTEEFVEHIRRKKIICYAHNGGKFDFMYLLSHVREGKLQIINGRIISMYIGECELVDSYAAVPESLKKIKKREIEMWKLERAVRAEHMPEIIHYLEGDCIYLLELMLAYRKAAGTRKTIAGNALAFAKKLGIDPGKTNYSFDQNFRPYYFGGRTQCFQPGTFYNITVYDIHSAYPYAMQHYHPTGDARTFKARSDFGDLNEAEISRSFIRLKCFSKGAFPWRDPQIPASGLQFPEDTREYHITGWEYLAAKELGLVSDEKLISVEYSDESITFKEYVEHWYNHKAAHPKEIDPINYTIGKTMMTSLYGKLAQNPARYYDYRILPIDAPLPCADPIPDADNDTCIVCEFKLMEHGWVRYSRFLGHDFHCRETLWKYKFRFGEQWESKPLYKNVATGASITGFTRAHLLKAAHAVGIEHVIYCDTDSLIVKEGHNSAGLPQSEAMGDWGLEIPLARIAHFAGKKLYAIELDPKKPCTCSDPQQQCKKHKVVTKGARLSFKDMEKIVNGETVIYEPQAPTYSIARGIGFVPRKIRRTA
jgi:hypothetical protein